MQQARQQTGCSLQLPFDANSASSWHLLPLHGCHQPANQQPLQQLPVRQKLSVDSRSPSLSHRAFSGISGIHIWLKPIIKHMGAFWHDTHVVLGKDSYDAFLCPLYHPHVHHDHHHWMPLPPLLSLESVDRQVDRARACSQKERRFYSSSFGFYTIYCERVFFLFDLYGEDCSRLAQSFQAYERNSVHTLTFLDTISVTDFVDRIIVSIFRSLLWLLYSRIREY